MNKFSYTARSKLHYFIKLKKINNEAFYQPLQNVVHNGENYQTKIKNNVRDDFFKYLNTVVAVSLFLAKSYHE